MHFQFLKSISKKNEIGGEIDEKGNYMWCWKNSK